MSRSAHLLPLMLMLGGCFEQASSEEEARYHAAMSALLNDNAALASDFQDLAARIKQERPEAKAVAKELDNEMVKNARSLAERVGTIQTTSAALAAAHPLVVQAWEGRVSCYETVIDAYRTEDPEAYEGALEDCYRSKLTEDRYFAQVNRALGPHGLALEPYPVATEAAAE